MPVDFSAQSEAAVALATELVGSAFDRILILHVVHEPGERAGYYRSQDESGGLRSIPDVAADMLAEFVETMRRRYPESALLQQARALTVSGLPAQAIHEVAEREGAGMIVIGSRRRSSFARLLRGSVAEQVARTNTCPVMLTRDPHVAGATTKTIHAVPAAPPTV